MTKPDTRTMTEYQPNDIIVVGSDRPILRQALMSVGKILLRPATIGTNMPALCNIMDTTERPSPSYPRGDWTAMKRGKTQR